MNACMFSCHEWKYIHSLYLLMADEETWSEWFGLHLSFIRVSKVTERSTLNHFKASCRCELAQTAWFLCFPWDRTVPAAMKRSEKWANILKNVIYSIFYFLLYCPNLRDIRWSRAFFSIVRIISLFDRKFTGVEGMPTSSLTFIKRNSILRSSLSFFLDVECDIYPEKGAYMKNKNDFVASKNRTAEMCEIIHCSSVQGHSMRATERIQLYHFLGPPMEIGTQLIP